MSHVDNGQGGQSQMPQSRANFDQTSRGGTNRDAWNNPLPKERTPAGGGGGEDKTGEDDNAGIDEQTIATIFDKIENKDKKDNSQTQQTQVQPAPMVDADKQMKDYLSKVGLTGVEVTDADKEAMSNGDYSSFLTKVNSQIVNAHVKALSGAKELVDNAIKEAGSKIKDQSISYMLGQQNLAELHRQLPWSREKHIAPVAQSIMQKFLERGWSTDKAIEGTRAYFDDIDARRHSGDKSRSQNFSSSGNSEQEKENNWLNVLSPQRKA